MNGWDWYQRFWAPAAIVISNMERFGVPLATAACERELERLRDEREVLEIALKDWAGQDIGWGSWQQLQQYLYGTTISPATKDGEPIVPKGFPVPPIKGTLRAVQSTKAGEQPTSEASLWWLSDHVDSLEDRQGLRNLLQWKKLRRMESFFASLPWYAEIDGRVRCELRPVPESGRLSARYPNLQQQPNDYEDPTEQVWPGTRLAFVAAPGNLLICRDYDGLEWRILAHILAYKYDDTSMVDEIVKGIDPHSATPIKMGLIDGDPEDMKRRAKAGEQPWKRTRDVGKILNYSINYGKTAHGLGIQIRDDNGDPIGKYRGQELLDGFYAARPGVARFHKDIVHYARTCGFVRSLLGRRRYIDFKKHKAPRQAMNVIQNCAADIMLMAMLRCNAEPEPELVELGYFNKDLHRMGVRQLLNIHDELLFECPERHAEEANEIIANEMANALTGVREFCCPLSTSGGIGPNWNEAK